MIEVQARPRSSTARSGRSPGHWDKYRANMFVCETAEGETLALKPMNCPGHVQIFKVGQKSYRDLPLRMAEFGACHRYEPSGALHGLMRVRAFTQDDAHIFCREDQIEEETTRFIEPARTRSTPISGMEAAPASRWPRARNCAPARTSSGTRPRRRCWPRPRARPASSR